MNIELTEKQLEEIICGDCPHRIKDKDCGCGCDEYDRIRHYSLEKKYIKQSPVEKAEETLNYIKSEKKPLMTYRLAEYELDNIVNGFNDLKKQLEEKVK